MVGVVAIVVITIALIFITRTIRGTGGRAYRYGMDFKCEQCDYVFREDISSRQKFPIRCGECGKRAAYPVLKCFNCGNLFYIKDMEKELEWLGACPKCGSMKVCPPSMSGEQIKEMFPE